MFFTMFGIWGCQAAGRAGSSRHHVAAALPDRKQQWADLAQAWQAPLADMQRAWISQLDYGEQST